MDMHTKRHEDLLRLIWSRIMEAGERGLRTYAEPSHMNRQCKDQPMFVIAKDGYQFLVECMFGKKVNEHQIDCIKAFIARVALLRNH